jgi:hypothetical protein
MEYQSGNSLKIFSFYLRVCFYLFSKLKLLLRAISFQSEEVIK